MVLTAKQQKALEAAFKKGGAWYGRRGNCMGGAYARMCERLAAMGLVAERGPYAITVRGMVVLEDLWTRRWGQHGCMAYLEDLQAIQAALAEMPALAACARRKLAA